MQAAEKNREMRKKAYGKLIEAELCNYEATKKELVRLRRRKQKGISAAAMLHIEKTVNAIEKAYKLTQGKPDGENRIRMLEMKYEEGNLNDEGIMLEIPVCKTTFYKWKKEFIELVGDFLGYDV